MKKGKKDEVSIIEFLTKRFPDEKTAEAFFVERRWGGHILCPYCRGDKIYKVSGGQPYKCAKCLRKFTAKTGTIMEGSHVPIRMWLLAMFLMGTSRKGISSIELAKTLSVTQKTAWFMAQRIREACTEMEKLRGEVEVDEAYIGGLEKNKHANKRTKGAYGGKGKVPVVGLKERHGRVIARVVDDTSRFKLQGLIKKYVSKKATIYTDDHPSYLGISRRGYPHYVVRHSQHQYVNGRRNTNSIESVWAVLKRGVYGTYHHVSKKHLQRYVDEFCFRLSKGGTVPFIEAVCLQASGKTLKYKGLTA